MYLADYSSVGSIIDVSLTDVNISLDFPTAIYSSVQMISTIYIS